MSWIALVPLKGGGPGGLGRKSRLAPLLDEAERSALCEAMAGHVLDRLAACPAIADIRLLSPDPPRRPGVGWLKDLGRGLNGELDAARRALPASGLLVVHADLPLLERADIEAMLSAAKGAGIALAPDRHGLGTNAVALAPGAAMSFGFGGSSFARHHARAPGAAIVERCGLQWDVDTPEDLMAVGPVLPLSAAHA